MLKQCITLALLLALLGAALRLTLIASSTELGPSFIATQWQDAFLGLIGEEYASIGDRPPSEQADYWLREVELVVDENPDSAPIHMGAAWVLDSPDVGFMHAHLKQNEIAAAFPEYGLELNVDAISSANAEFRDKCASRCVELAERATQLESDDVRWRRMLALLVFEGDMLPSGEGLAPRVDRCLQILDQCKQHDPSNALYDYLAALLLWNQSANYEWAIENEETNKIWRLTVDDENKFAKGTRRFMEGQSKDFLAIGEEGYSAVPQFLEVTRTPISDQAKVAVSRLVTFRHATLFMRLWRWQNIRADQARVADDADRQLAILRQNLKLFDQSISADETSALTALKDFDELRRDAYESIEELVDSGAVEVGPAEMTKMREREELLRAESATLQAALKKLAAESYPKPLAFSLPTILSVVASELVAALLVLAAVLLLLANILSKDRGEPTSLGVWRQVAAWAAGIGATFLVFGMAPAEMIGRESQRLIVVAGLWGVAIGLAGVVAWCVAAMLRRRGVRPLVVTLSAAIMGAIVVASLWFNVHAMQRNPASGIQEQWLHAKGWSGIDAEVLRAAMKVQKESWQWAATLWLVHGGIYFGLAIALVLITAWFMRLRAREANVPFSAYWTQGTRGRWAALPRSVAKSAFIAAMCWLLAYLWMAPDVVRLVERTHQFQMRYCRDPEAHYREIRETQADIRAAAIARENQAYREDNLLRK
jgi:hypothetical protein